MDNVTVKNRIRSQIKIGDDGVDFIKILLHEFVALAEVEETIFKVVDLGG